MPYKHRVGSDRSILSGFTMYTANTGRSDGRSVSTFHGVILSLACRYTMYQFCISN